MSINPLVHVPARDADAHAFEQDTRLAEYLAKAELFVPAHLRGKPADLLLVLRLAKTSGRDPIHILQSTYVIGGKIGFSAQYILALINSSGRIRGPVQWREKGSGDSLEVTAFATLVETGAEISITVSMEMAKAEGWTRRNSKYQTMPVLMLRYRSATLLGRMYFPDVLLGFHDQYELTDAAPVYTDPEPAPQSGAPPARISVEGAEAAEAGSFSSSSASEAEPVRSRPSQPPGADDHERAARFARIDELKQRHGGIVGEEVMRLGLRSRTSATIEQLDALIEAIESRAEREAIEAEPETFGGVE